MPHLFKLVWYYKLDHLLIYMKNLCLKETIIKILLGILRVVWFSFENNTKFDRTTKKKSCFVYAIFYNDF